MKRALAWILIFLLLFVTAACGKEDQGRGGQAMAGQKEIARIGRYEEEIPADYAWFDYKASALAFDGLVFGKNTQGKYLPLIWQDGTNDTFGFAAYVGDPRNGADGAQEAVATAAAILSATLLGIDKSSQAGEDYVAQLHAYFSQDEGVVLNNPGGTSKGASMWYMLYPTILFTQISLYYPQETQIREDALSAIESWYQAYQVMAETGSFDYTGFDFTEREPYENGVWKEPDSAAGIAVLMKLGYELTGKEEYRDAMIQCLDYLADFNGSPLYEVLLYFAPSLAAQMNAQCGMDYDLEDLLGDVLNGGSVPRGGWGSILGTWGDYCMNGTMGSTTDQGGYAFSMNTFAGGYALASVAKYDTRYARAMGIWFVNAASAGRYFFPGESLQENQSASQDPDTMEFLKLSGGAIPYEGIRKSGNSKTPWIGGDPTVYGWAETDLSLYSGAHTGLFASTVEQTDTEGILKVNCNVAETPGQGYATYLLYNPYGQAKNVNYSLPQGRWDLFDSVQKRTVAEGAEKELTLTLEPGQAVVIVEMPEGSQVVHENGQYRANGVWIASDTVTVALSGIQNNDSVKGKVTLDVRVTATDPSVTVEEIVLEIDGKETTFQDPEKVTLQTADYTPGSKSIFITVRMSDGKTDTTSIRLNFKE